jgi:hypothetical protein
MSTDTSTKPKKYWPQEVWDNRRDEFIEIAGLFFLHIATIFFLVGCILVVNVIAFALKFNDEYVKTLHDYEFIGFATVLGVITFGFVLEIATLMARRIRKP